MELAVDLRDTEESRRNKVQHDIQSACDGVAARRKVAIRLMPINADAPAQSSPEIVGALITACEVAQLPFRKMVSRAYHDSLFMARIAPVAMLFIPCRGGISHRPDEYAAPRDIARGVQVLAHTLALLSASV